MRNSTGWLITRFLARIFGLGVFYLAITTIVVALACVYNGYICYWIWEWLAVSKGMPLISPLVWIAAILIHSAGFSSSYAELFPRETLEERVRWRKFAINELITKPVFTTCTALLIRFFV